MADYSYDAYQPMRVQVRKGSAAERLYLRSSTLPGMTWPMPKAIARGIDPSPLDDLMYHGGKVVPQMQFQNIYLGGAAAWQASDLYAIDSASALAMRDRRLNNVMVQYFPGAKVSCDVRPSFVDEAASAKTLDEPDVQAAVKRLYDDGKIARSDLGETLFNLILPPGNVLKLGSSTSRNGLGGYHGSVHFKRQGKMVTVYYSANVYSEIGPGGRQNGIVAFDRPWKNVVATLYHEINEFRTDPDVGDAIASRSNDPLGWTSRKGHEIGDQPIFVARDLALVFQEVKAATGRRKLPIQLMYSNAVHGAEGPISRPHA